MPNSSTVTSGQQATAAQYNNLRADAINASTGHGHSGTGEDGVYLGTVPIGGIILWSGAADAIPTNWALCDGANGTPDLRGRFVMGRSSTSIEGTSGGAATLNLSHTHAGGAISVSAGSAHYHSAGSLSTTSSGAHTHDLNREYNDDNPGDYYGVIPYQLASNGAHTHNSWTGATANESSHTHTPGGTTASGGNTAASVMPPYKAYCYIMRVA